MSENGGPADTVVQIEKVWAAVDGDRIVVKAESRQAVLDELRNQADDPAGYEIVALPKNAGGGPF